MPISSLRRDARSIWQAAVDAVHPRTLLPHALSHNNLRNELRRARRIVVIGAGKAGAAMSAALEDALADLQTPMEGVVNVPAESCRPLKWIHLHPARPRGTNQPTAAGVAGANRILALAESADRDTLGICLVSGGGSALLPAPVPDITLEDKQRVTELLHACGATINEMNAVRKHLSRIKGGRLAQSFRGKALYSLIISDVIGDPLDVIASGPTAPDPTTFADAVGVIDKYGLQEQVSPSVSRHLQRGAAEAIPETPKSLPAEIHNVIIGNNARALSAAEMKAVELGYEVVNLGSDIAGDTGQAADSLANRMRTLKKARPTCILSGGETTVTLGPDHGLGGRNQEFVLALALGLGMEKLEEMVILSGGTDGEDGPTDAAGAVADASTFDRAARLRLDPRRFLEHHDAYHFFEATGDLVKTGLTETNVMDVRVILTT